MNPLLATLGTRLTERWLNLLVLPGALFLGVASVGVPLGHRHWHDLDRLRTSVDDLATRPALDWTGTAVLLAAGVLLAATAASLAAQFLAGVIELYWLRPARDPLSHALAAARDRVAMLEPVRPTWYGDRMRAAPGPAPETPWTRSPTSSRPPSTSTAGNWPRGSV
jgi:hypothetical protein